MLLNREPSKGLHQLFGITATIILLRNMEVFVRNLPEQLSEKQLRDFLRPIFTSLSIDSFCCQKLRKGCATVTILDPQLGQKFLDLHGQSSGTRRGTQAIRQLHHMGRAIHVSASRNKPDTYLLRSLREENQKLQQSKETKTGKGPIIRHERKFPCSALACGLWDYAGSDLVFISYFTDSRKGAVTFGTKSLAVLLDPPSVQIPKVQIDIPYNSVRSITVGDGSNLSLTLTLLEAPRIYEDSADALKTLLLGAFDNLSLRTQPKSFKKSRITSISKAHESVVSSCFVYRLSLSGTSISQVRALKNFREVPSCIFWPTAVTDPERSFASETTELISTLCLQYEELPFSLKFQMQKLAQNGYLPPSRIVALLPEILHMVSRSGVATTLHATRKLFNQIPFAGPETEAKELGLRGLTELLARSELSSQIEMLYLSDHVERHEHIAPTYKATVTPAGTYLYGPDPEPKNRVLRKYSDHSDFFLRVTFVDEDGEPIRFDNNASNGQIYHERFKRVLGGVINIAGRGYEFLGFSHSSLRSQTCWFMAPFVQNGELFHARAVIAKLGDFSAIRSPAKCAARIGQAFSETSKTVKLPPNAVRTMKDVERSGRVFSDGVGTFSNSILQRIWKEYATSHILKPKLFQIRYAGK